jgi:hypothetical protein
MLRNSVNPESGTFAAKSGHDYRLSANRMLSTGFNNGRRTRNDPSSKAMLTDTASHSATNWQASKGTINRTTGKGWMMKVPISSAAAYMSTNASPL